MLVLNGTHWLVRFLYELQQSQDDQPQRKDITLLAVGLLEGYFGCCKCQIRVLLVESDWFLGDYLLVVSEAGEFPFAVRGDEDAVKGDSQVGLL